MRVAHGGAGNEALVLASTTPRRTPIAERVWTRIDATGDCWEWTGSRNHLGYGTYSFNVGGQVVSAMAHRLVYALLVGPIPPGLTLDHHCRNRSCVCPDHLEVVTHAENLRRSPIAPTTVNARKSACINGHPFDAVNTYVTPAGHRACRLCRVVHLENYYARLRAALREEAAVRA